jgi:hypothetical protein
MARKEKLISLTIKDAINALKIAARRSPLGENTVITLCENDREYTDFQDIGIDIAQEGATCLISLHKLSTRPQSDGIPTSCHYIDKIDRMTPEEVLDECISQGVDAGGWPDGKCRDFLRKCRKVQKDIAKGIL